MFFSVFLATTQAASVGVCSCDQCDLHSTHYIADMCEPCAFLGLFIQLLVSIRHEHNCRVQRNIDRLRGKLLCALIVLAPSLNLASDGFVLGEFFVLARFSFFFFFYSST